VLSVGDLAFRKRCMGKMQEVSRGGRTILFVSHEMNAIRRLCHKGLWLDDGQVRKFGEVRAVAASYESAVAGRAAGARVERAPVPEGGQKCFSWVSLSSAGHDPSSTVRFGQLLHVRLGMAGRTAHKTHFVEWFLSDAAGGNRVAWGATHALPDGDVSGDSRQVAFLIGPLPLAEGRYLFSFAMGVAGVAALDFWNDAILFEVVGADPNGSGYHYTTNYAPTLIPYRRVAEDAG